MCLMLKTQGRGPSDFPANVALPLISQALNYSKISANISNTD